MSMDSPLVIYGAGGLGRELVFLIRRTGSSILGFLDDKIPSGSYVNGIPVLGALSWLQENKAELVLAFGKPSLKEDIFAKIKSNELISLSQPMIDPDARVLDWDNIQIGLGSVITAGVAITANVKIGQCTLINLNSTIGHDVNIGDFSTLMPGCHISGNVNIGRRVLIGSGAVILGGIHIGDDAVVGAGSVVNRDVEPGKTVVGVPARRI